MEGASMPASELIERVAELIVEVGPSVPASLQPELAALEARLREPARIAVVGPVKAGKSTLVNALLGQRVAPTDVGECTQIVTWFHYGHPQRLVIHLRDGTKVEGQLGADGMLPAELGLPPGSVESLHAYLANETLRWMTLIDTPGLGSVHGDFSQSTEALLAASRDSEEAAARADALLFLINHTVKEDQLDALRLFSGSAGDGGVAVGSAANAVAVLSRADQLGAEGDVWEVALELAGQYATALRNQVSTVVPIIGLLAETAEAAVLTELAAKDLRTLAGMEVSGLRKLLWSADRFTTGDAPIPVEARERLLTMLDLYGIERGVELIRDGTSGAGALRRQLSELSRIGEVKRTLTDYFSAQDHVLKVRSALEVLWRLSYTDAEGDDEGGRGLATLRSGVEALRLDPVMQPVAELEVWHDCCTGRVDMPEGCLEEMRRLFAPGTLAGKVGISTAMAADAASPDAVRAAAKDAMGRWRAFMVNQASPAQARVARVVLRSYQLVWAATA
jgi:hypothetical protein